MIPDYLKPPELTSQKTYGSLKKINNQWIVKGHPYMVSMAKRLFPGSKGEGRGKAKFSATKRSVGDLNWFMKRFPLKIKNLDEWKHDLLDAQKHFEVQEEFLHKPKKVTPLPTFKGQLKEFQKEGLAFLLHNPRSLLADEMGLGKTPTGLAWLTTLKNATPGIIIVPPHLLRQWQDEIEKFLGFDIKIHIIKGLSPYDLPNADIYLIHYLLLRGWLEYLPRFGFRSCIFDEIQELRHSTSKKYSSASLLAESVDNVVGLSGTPIYNYGAEMWNVLNILEYHCLGDFGDFSSEWCSYYGGHIIEDPKLFGEYLKNEGLLLRRTKEEVMSELPPKRRNIHYIDIDKDKFDTLISPIIDQAKQIPHLEKKFKSVKTKDAIDKTRRITGIAKAKYVCDFVRTLLEAGETVLLYGHHHDVIDIYLKELYEYSPVIISGRENAKEKDNAQKSFMKGRTNLIIVSLRSGIGLNLYKAKCVVFGELDWSPAVHTQCEDRAHRIGVRDSVLCYYLVCNAGTDFAMQETLGLKSSQFLNIMGDRLETEQDKLLAQTDSRQFMKDVIDKLQKGTILTRRHRSPKKSIQKTESEIITEDNLQPEINVPVHKPKLSILDAYML